MYNDVERRARKTPLWVSYLEFTLLCVWDVAHFLWVGKEEGGNGIGFFEPQEMLVNSLPKCKASNR